MPNPSTKDKLKARVALTVNRSATSVIAEQQERNKMNNHSCEKSPCNPPKRERWMTGDVETPMGNIPKVETHLAFYDTLGTIKVRLALGR